MAIVNPLIELKECVLSLLCYNGKRVDELKRTGDTVQ